MSTYNLNDTFTSISIDFADNQQEVIRDSYLCEPLYICFWFEYIFLDRSQAFGLVYGNFK